VSFERLIEALHNLKTAGRSKWSAGCACCQSKRGRPVAIRLLVAVAVVPMITTKTATATTTETMAEVMAKNSFDHDRPDWLSMSLGWARNGRFRTLIESPRRQRRLPSALEPWK
jgi:hypothetical protein